MVKEHSKLSKLEEIMRAKYPTSQQDLRRYVSQENQLRDELRKLDKQARDADSDVESSMKTIGADIIWKSWVGRTKTELNLQLAQILAQKEGYLNRVRKDYGKLLVAEELRRKQLEDIRYDARTRRLSDSIEMALAKRKKTAK